MSMEWGEGVHAPMNPFSRDQVSTAWPQRMCSPQRPAPSAAPNTQSVNECMPVYRRPNTMLKTYTPRTTEAPMYTDWETDALRYAAWMYEKTRSAMETLFVLCVEGKPYSRWCDPMAV